MKYTRYVSEYEGDYLRMLREAGRSPAEFILDSDRDYNLPFQWIPSNYQRWRAGGPKLANVGFTGLLDPADPESDDLPFIPFIGSNAENNHVAFEGIAFYATGRRTVIDLGRRDQAFGEPYHVTGFEFKDCTIDNPAPRPGASRAAIEVTQADRPIVRDVLTINGFEQGVRMAMDNEGEWSNIRVHNHRIGWRVDRLTAPGNATNSKLRNIRVLGPNSALYPGGNGVGFWCASGGVNVDGLFLENAGSGAGEGAGGYAFMVLEDALYCNFRDVRFSYTAATGDTMQRLVVANNYYMVNFAETVAYASDAPAGPAAYPPALIGDPYAGTDVPDEGRRIRIDGSCSPQFAEIMERANPRYVVRAA